MNMQTAFQNLNWLAIFLAALSTFLIGGLWYSVFKTSWMKVNNLTEERLNQRNLPFVFGLSFLLSLLMALNLALFIGDGNAEFGAIAGFMTGFGWVAFSFGIVALFENKPLKYVLINGGYMVVAFTFMGAILGYLK